MDATEIKKTIAEEMWRRGYRPVKPEETVTHGDAFPFLVGNGNLHIQFAWANVRDEKCKAIEEKFSTPWRIRVDVPGPSHEICADCKVAFQLEKGCYIGPREGPENTDCNPNMTFVSYCVVCAKTHGFG